MGDASLWRRSAFRRSLRDSADRSAIAADAAPRVGCAERTTRALNLTTAGHTLLDEVEPLLQALDRSLAQVARRAGRATLRLLLPPFFASELFIPRLASFCAAHPDIDIQTDTRDPRPAIHPPTADVSILLSDEVPQGLRSARLFPLSLTPVCAPEHAAAVARPGSDFLVSRPRDADKAEVRALTHWALAQFAAEP